MVLVGGLAISPLARSCASQAPQSADGEDDGEERGDAEQEVRKSPEEGQVGVANPAADKSGTHHVNDWDERPEERSEEDDDVPPFPLIEQERPAEPHDHDQNSHNVFEAPRFQTEGDFGREVKDDQEDREERKDGQQGAVFHRIFSM